MTSLHPGPVLPEGRQEPASFGARYPYRYAALDVETTGFSAGRDRIVQVAVTLLDEHGAVESSWSTLVDPERDPGPVHVHGITAERLAGAPLFADVAAELAGLLAGRVFVAHNAVFDWGFVAAEMRRAGVALDVEQRLCTRNLAKRLDLPVADLKLATLAAHWRVEQLRAHDAEDDTRVLVEVLRHALRTAAACDLDLPLTRCSAEPPPPRPRSPRRTGFPVPAAAAPVAPTAPGPLAGRQVLVLGGSHDEAAAVRALVAARGGIAAVQLSAGTTDVVALPGAEADPRWRLARELGLTVLDLSAPRGTRPARPGSAPAPVVAPAAVPAAPAAPAVLVGGAVLDLPRSDRPWLLDLRWARAALPVDVVVQRFDALGLPLGAALRGTRASLDGTVVVDVDTSGEAEVWLHLDAAGPDVARVVVSAHLPHGVTFADVGAVVLAVRAPRGSVLAVATLDAAAGARSLVLADVRREDGAWRLRVVRAAAEAA
ncbi:exonuclease domain-containing protein [Kineococcus gypseus]|uniref:exonuclease domain-containing protein n=1 Tax=Kineococcus gypseus TaxID=1637102 RepID=UPI003D7CC099